MKGLGIVAIIYGAAAIFLGLLGIFFLAAQNLFLELLPDYMEYPEGFDIRQTIVSLYTIWIVFVPLMMLIGVLFLFGGIRLYNNREMTGLLKAASVANIIWYISYVAAILIFLVPEISITGIEIGGLITVGVLISAIINALIIIGFPVFLLVYLKDRKSRIQTPPS